MKPRSRLLTRPGTPRSGAMRPRSYGRLCRDVSPSLCSLPFRPKRRGCPRPNTWGGQHQDRFFWDFLPANPRGKQWPHPAVPTSRPALRKALGLDAASSAHKLCAFAVGDCCLPGRGTGAEGHVGFPFAPSVRAPQLPRERRRLGRLTWTCGANWPSGGGVREPLGPRGGCVHQRGLTW